MIPSKHSGFSIIEMIVVLMIMALVAALIVPRFFGLREGSLSQVAQDHRYTFEVALQSWTGSLPSVSTSISNFGANLDMAEGYFSTVGTACGSCTPKVSDFVDPQFLSSAGLNIHKSGGAIGYSTSVMRELTGTLSSVTINGVSIAPVANVEHAHFRVVWTPTTTSGRINTHPAIVLFLPN